MIVQGLTHRPRANLNDSYFTNRQDRYIHIKAHPQLAQYCFGFLDACGRFSYRLLPSPAEGYTLHWADKSVHPHHIEEKAAQVLSHFQAAYRLGSASGLPIVNRIGEDTPHDVLIFPIIQAGQFGVREEERALAALFDELANRSGSTLEAPYMDLTSGYFGIYQKYCDLILRSHVDCRILAAAPKVRGSGHWSF